MAGGWELLDHDQLGSAGTLIDCNGSGSGFALKDYLWIQVTFKGEAGGSGMRMRFNANNTNGDYRYRNFNNGGVDTGSADAWNPMNQSPSDNDSWVYFDMFIDNKAGTYKICESVCCLEMDSGSTYPRITQNWGRFAGTDQIKRVQVINDNAGTLDMAQYSSITVWGATPAPANDYPNLPNGVIFEESDTGKHYMFDGTSTWNEMT